MMSSSSGGGATTTTSATFALFVSTTIAIVASMKLYQTKAGRKKQQSQEEEKEKTTMSSSKNSILKLRQQYFCKAVSISYANSNPLLITSGNGSRLVDESGVEYLDTRNNVAHIGHCHRAVVEAVQNQVAQLNTNTRYLHPNITTLAQHLITKYCPDPLEKVFFVNSGSEANDLALRLARAYTGGCKNTIVVEGSYHGHTCSVLEVSPYKYEHSQEFDLKPQPTNATMWNSNNYKTPGRHIWKVPAPDTYRGKHQDVKTAGTQYAKYVRDACGYYKSKGQKVSAFILEGGMSVPGVILPPPNYIRESVAAVRNAGGLYIADEVQTGLGRFGSCFWAFQYDNDAVIPDIVTIGKPFGNGMPLAAVITTRQVSEAFEALGVEYFNTFGGNPVSAAAGLAVLDALEAEKLQQHALEVGNYLKTKFWQLDSKLDIIGDVRGSGLFLGVELVRSKTTKEPATEETSFICSTLKEKYHILTSIDGLHENVLIIKPPMCFSREDCDTFVTSFELAVTVDLKAVGLDNVRSMDKTPT